MCPVDEKDSLLKTTQDQNAMLALALNQLSREKYNEKDINVNQNLNRSRFLF